MRVTARADYAVRAAVELVGAGPGAPRKAESLSVAQGIPLSFLENILNQLKSAGVVRSQRGPEGGWWLLRAPDELTVADVIRAVEGRWRAFAASAPSISPMTGRRNRSRRCGSRCARTSAASSST